MSRIFEIDTLVDGARRAIEIPDNVGPYRSSDVVDVTIDMRTGNILQAFVRADDAEMQAGLVASSPSDMLTASCRSLGAAREPGDPMPVPTRSDPDKACAHLDFVANVNVARMLDGMGDPPPQDVPATSYSAEITVQCKNCGEPFRFMGVQAGLMPSRPMCSIDETELRAPIRPASSDPDFGLGIPGFAIQYREGDASA